VDSKEDLVDIRKGLGKIANVGSDIAAGSFNQGVDELRHLVWESPLSKAVPPTLELCPPSLTHLFSDDARIREALEADRRRPYQAGLFRSKPNFSPRSNKSKTWTKKKSKPARKSRGKSSYSGPVGKAPGPASKKARRINEFIKGGRGGGSRVSVPSPDPSPCHDSLAICPRPTTIWRSGADCATSFHFGRKS
jgi:hypothetical protein